jgi:competence protein ComEC
MSLSLLLALGAGLGTTAGVFLDPDLAARAPLVAAAASCVALLASARRWTAAARGAVSLAFAAAACGIGAMAEARALNPPLRSLLESRLGGFALDSVESARPDTPILLEGRLTGDARPREAGAGLELDVERVWLGPAAEPVSGGLSLAVGGELAAGRMGEWRAGRTLRLPALLRRPARYLDRGVPDQERALARRGIALVGSVKSAALVEVVAPGGRLDEAAASVRARVRAALARHVGTRDERAGAIATAILIGDRGQLAPEVQRRLQEAGTYHVIAISGGNIAILASLVLGVFWWTGIGRRASATAAIAVLAVYAFVVGGQPSVLRATLMAVVYLSLRLADQRTSPRHALALAAAALLLVWPLSVADAGFWLTFGATAAIVAAADLVTLPRAWWARGPAVLVLASVAAEAALLPIGALVFQRATVAGVALNLIAVPCMTVTQISAMVTVTADATGLEAMAAAAGWITRAAAAGLVGSAALVDLAPWTTWRVPSPSLRIVVAYYVALVAWVTIRLRRDALAEGHNAHEGHEANPLIPAYSSWLVVSRVSGVAAMGLLLWIAAAPPTLARARVDRKLHLTVMDVGQGDALLATLPDGHTLMIDAGGLGSRTAFDVGDRVLGPALRARLLARLDYLAITHGDPDHIGGAVALVHDFAPGEVWIGVPVNAHEPTEGLRRAADGVRAGWRTLQRGDRFEAGGVELRVHHPPLPDWERQKARNDDSLVIEVRFGQVSMLLTGDISREVEQQLVPRLDLLPVVVLKAPHHGSGTSSSAEFLAGVRPAAVLISCGRGNPYGHPVPYVLERYRQSGAAVFRTDQDGQIEVVTDGHTVDIETFTGRRWRLRDR